MNKARLKIDISNILQENTYKKNETMRKKNTSSTYWQKKSKKRYFENIAKTEKNQTGKSFWNSVKPFIRNKGGNIWWKHSHKS